MDVRNWEFLDKQLAQLGDISRELAGSGIADKIAYTAFFWVLITYHASADDKIFQAGAMSLPDHLTPTHRTKIEAICADLDTWLRRQDVTDHPQAAALRQAIDLGLQATTHPLFGSVERP
ncbi:MAG: hypothetical protein HY866_08795 [Chloroflexi bacterium]|nr:hypothetical protein [Chloroflexota bacterium]